MKSIKAVGALLAALLLSGCAEIQELLHDKEEIAAVIPSGEEIAAGVSEGLDMAAQAVSDNTRHLKLWLDDNLWDILGHTNIEITPDMCEFFIADGARLYTSDIDSDGVTELIQSLSCGACTRINLIYKPSGEGLSYYGYCFDGVKSIDRGGVYSDGGSKRYFCSKCVASGGVGQPYKVELFEMRFGSSLELTPLLSCEFRLSADEEFLFVSAEHNGNEISTELEYNRLLEDIFGDYVKTSELMDCSNGLAVPFSVAAKELTTDKQAEEIINWICDGLYE